MSDTKWQFEVSVTGVSDLNQLRRSVRALGKVLKDFDTSPKKIEKIGDAFDSSFNKAGSAAGKFHAKLAAILDDLRTASVLAGKINFRGFGGSSSGGGATSLSSGGGQGRMPAARGIGQGSYWNSKFSKRLAKAVYSTRFNAQGAIMPLLGDVMALAGLTSVAPYLGAAGIIGIGAYKAADAAGALTRWEGSSAAMAGLEGESGFAAGVRSQNFGGDLFSESRRAQESYYSDPMSGYALRKHGYQAPGVGIARKTNSLEDFLPALKDILQTKDIWALQELGLTQYGSLMGASRAQIDAALPDFGSNMSSGAKAMGRDLGAFTTEFKDVFTRQLPEHLLDFMDRLRGGAPSSAIANEPQTVAPRDAYSRNASSQPGSTGLGYAGGAIPLAWVNSQALRNAQEINGAIALGAFGY